MRRKNWFSKETAIRARVKARIISKISLIPPVIPMIRIKKEGRKKGGVVEVFRRLSKNTCPIKIGRMRKRKLFFKERNNPKRERKRRGEEKFLPIKDITVPKLLIN